MLGTRILLPSACRISARAMIQGTETLRQYRQSKGRRCRILAASLPVALILGFMVGAVPVAAQPSGPTLKRVVEFRDGTVIIADVPRSQLPWKSVTRDGRITEMPTPFDTVDRIDFVRSPVTKQVEIIRSLINELGAANYQKRQDAHRKLVEIGGQYRPVIVASEKTEEPEVRWRIQDILENVSGSDIVQRNDFDRLTMAGGEVRDGDIGDWEAQIDYRGTRLTLNREHVLSIYKGEIDLNYDGESGVAEVERIPDDDPAYFPVNLNRLDFDRTPSGNDLEVGTDVSDVYVDLGVTITSSVPNSSVVVQSYKVKNNQSAANATPTYTGTIIFRFCVPGSPRLPASVRSIGCWASYISPSGTYLQAFDARDRLIGEVSTTKSGAEFLALKSSVPIAYCKLHPDEAVDPDYAFDDFVFDGPRPLLESGDPDLNSVVLINGERLQAQGLKIDADKVELTDLTIGTKWLTIPRAEIAVIVPKVAGQDSSTADDSLADLPRVQMKNGSLVVVSPEPTRGLRLARSQQGQVDLTEIASLWGANTSPVAATAEDLEAGPFVILDEERLVIPDVAIGANWITAVALTNRDLHFEYAESPVVWLQIPEPVTAQQGVIRTKSGESYVFGSSAFSLTQWDSEQITLAWKESTLTIPFDEVRSIRFPLAN